MRYDTPIFFQKITKGKYDPDTGNYADDYIEETQVYASATSAGEETLKLVYGEIKEGSLVIRTQQHYKIPFDCIRIEDKQYRVDFSRKLCTKHVFVISEVQ